MSTASPYRHFADRDALLVATIASAADSLTAAVVEAAEAAGARPSERLRAGAAAWVRITHATRIGVPEFVQPEIVAADPALVAACQRPVHVVRELVAAVVDTDADAVARDVLAVLHGFATLPAEAATADDTDLARAAADAVIRVLPTPRRPRRDSPDSTSTADAQPSLF